MQNIKTHLTRLLAFCCLCALSLPSTAQREFADVVLDAYYSGATPGFNDFYGTDPTNNCDFYLLATSVILGDTDTTLSLPTGSWVEVGFIDNFVYDAPNQNDLIIDESGASFEFGEVWVSSDYINFTFLDVINGGVSTSLDLEDYNYTQKVRAIRIVGLDDLGCVPGLDVARVYGIVDADCPSGIDFQQEETICNGYENYDLRQLSLNEQGYWVGPGISGNVLDVSSLSGVLDISFVLDNPNSSCPPDTNQFTIFIEDCDCAGQLGGTLILDECDVCLDEFDPSFNQSCLDCMGIPNGTAQVDYCGECLELDDPDFNQSCPEIYDIYIPNAFSPNGDGKNDFFQLFMTPGSGAQVLSYQVYDRWGNQVNQNSNFSIHNEDLPWWDGSFNGELTEAGVYAYLINIEYVTGEQEQFKGSFTLVR